MTAQLKIVYKKTEDLIPYARNSRTHDESQVAQIAASIKEFGWTNPILLDGENGIIAGHGRVLAAQKLSESKVPTIELAHMTDTQKKAYIIADNQLALNAGWDKEILGLEIEELKEEGFNIDLIGFDSKFLVDIYDESSYDEDDKYTQKTDIPLYEPSDIKPSLKFLYDKTKLTHLIGRIKDSKLPKEEKDFLLLAAGRHIVLNFEFIADYYAHSDKEMQELMEESALVIVDINKAITNGWVNLSKELSDIYTADVAE